MNLTLQKLLKPLASLKITVTLLLICCVLVLAGTTAQRDMGIQDVQRQFFHSWIAKIQLHYFQPTPAAGGAYLGGWFPLPGGFLLIILLLVNLLAAHTARFKFNRKRIGIILIHFGLILLLVGEWVTAHHAIESRMTIDVGGQSRWAEDIREAELAVVDPSPADHDNVIAVGEPNLVHSARNGQPVRDPRLPFEVKVSRWYDNANLRGPMEQGSGIDRLANAGSFEKLGLEQIPKFPGTEAERVDMPSAYITILKDGKDLGTYLLSTMFERDKPQDVSVGGKTYQLSLRFRRYYKPYQVTLNKFTHDVFPGTETARNFASEIRLVDPSRHVDREVKIWMNHPLRYGGETFYQQSFANNDRTSILQVVANPGWLMPYFACAIGALGLVIHFTMNLVVFLRRKFAPAAAPAAQASAKRGAPRRVASGPTADSYTLRPPPAWATLGVPGAFLGVCVIYLIARMIPAGGPASSYNWDAFGRLPIQFEGRVQPIDSWARNSLSLLSGHPSVRDDKGEATKDVPPAQWLLETMSQTGKWADYKVVRIDHPEIKNMLGMKETEKYFSWSDLFKNRENPRKLDEQSRLAAESPAKLRDAFQNQMIDLHQRLGIFLRLRQVDAISGEYQMRTHPEHVREMFGRIGQAVATVDPTLMSRIQAGGEDLHQAFNDALMKLDLQKLPAEQREAVAEFMEQSDRTSLLHRLGPAEELYLSAPLKAGESWQPLSAAVRENDPPAGADAFLRIVQDYTRQSPGDFNGDVASYQAKLLSALPAESARVDYEAFFNRFDPFMVCMVFYIAIFVLAAGSWLGWTRPLARTAYWLLILTFFVHTFGIVSRIYLSGRPPVTNLYSASVFIGWGIVFFSIALERIFRNGIAMVAAAASGFGTMLLAAGLSSVDGDTMKQLQAVLDTNFWLGTHVVCVSMGYTATAFAGALSIVILVLGIFTPLLRKETSKEAGKMVYGIVCFAMLFSFVGTILGGIWADQSWGRFWGWDPKENGAVLVVLWNALILHARWGGLVKERGMMVMAVLGNIVTAWSFFGTNMLGIGLHAYGFMESAQFRLTIFCFSQLVLAAIGAFTPRQLWASAVEKSEEKKIVAV